MHECERRTEEKKDQECNLKYESSWPATVSDLCIVHRLALVSWACSCIAIKTEQNFYAIAFITDLCWTSEMNCSLQLS